MKINQHLNDPKRSVFWILVSLEKKKHELYIVSKLWSKMRIRSQGSLMHRASALGHGVTNSPPQPTALGSWAQYRVDRNGRPDIWGQSHGNLVMFAILSALTLASWWKLRVSSGKFAVGMAGLIPVAVEVVCWSEVFVRLKSYSWSCTLTVGCCCCCCCGLLFVVGCLLLVIGFLFFIFCLFVCLFVCLFAYFLVCCLFFVCSFVCSFARLYVRCSRRLSCGMPGPCR